MSATQDLVKEFSQLKTLPHVAIRLTKLMADDNTTVKDFEEVIKTDPTLVLRVLRMVNTPYFGLRQKVDSISRALVFIGLKGLRKMVLTEALKEVFNGGEEDPVFSRQRLWVHSAAVAVCSQMISERIFGIQGDNAYLCGILHDVGLIVEDQVRHDLFREACGNLAPDSYLPELERQYLETDHCAVGSLVAEDWKIPSEVRDAIKRHHQDLENVSPSSVTGIVQMAEYLVSKLDYPVMRGMNSRLSPPLVAHIKENIQEYKAIARDFPEEMKKAKQIYES